MPLIDAETPPSGDNATSGEAYYVVYFASGEPSWCPDCRDAVPALQAVFSPESAPTASIVRVGSREEWRSTPPNKYRLAPYNISGVPTVVKMQNGQEVARLGDKESQDESTLKKLIES